MGIKVSILWVALMLIGGGGVYAAKDNHVSVSDEGVPGVLKYAHQYQRDKSISSGVQKKMVSPEGGGITSNTELRRRLLLHEQELRKLKKENQSLRDRLNTAPVVAQEVEKNKDRYIAELKAALDESKKQSNAFVSNAEEAQEVLNRQIIELKKKLTLTDADNKTIKEQAGKESAELMSSLNALKKEMEEMPVVAPDLLKTESVQLTYATGVMLGRDMINLQSAQQSLGLRTDNRVLLAGIRDALNQKVLLNETELNSALHKAEEVAQKARQTVIHEQKKAGATYLEKFRKQKGVKQAKSGFWYRIEYIGDGDYIRGENTLVDVVVTEKLTDGTVVEDMDDRGRVISQTLGEYPSVFREVLMLMKNHGTTEMVVPPELAYGDEGYPPKVPPGATVFYSIRVEDVKPAGDGIQGASPQASKKKTEK
ncbi:TPA: FKBP-type peptidyl-prolyl cis-trans isomerase [Klebsiella pneumoniae]|nr:FKBP-type peptidyl-prolyl cis-trans isomerase [Klebsiella pneumoniae]